MFSLAKGIENAAVVCCFLTSEYEESEICKLELQYAQKRHKRIIPCILADINIWKPSAWLQSLIEDDFDINFTNLAEKQFQSIVNNLIFLIKGETSTLKPVEKPTYLSHFTDISLLIFISKRWLSEEMHKNDIILYKGPG